MVAVTVNIVARAAISANVSFNLELMCWFSVVVICDDKIELIMIPFECVF